MIITMLPTEALAGRKGIQKQFFGKHAQKFWCGFGDADSPISSLILMGLPLMPQRSYQFGARPRNTGTPGKSI